MANRLHNPQKDMISTEMYLKTIFELKEKKGRDPKAVELAKALGLSKASVSEMLKKMEREDHIQHKAYSPLKLTKKGLMGAKKVERKYQILTKFLTYYLKIDEKKAHLEACILEHAISDEVVTRLDILMRFLEQDKRKNI
jgi:DtxR family Mn-dependent transcriptional regulator